MSNTKQNTNNQSKKDSESKLLKDSTAPVETKFGKIQFSELTLEKIESIFSELFLLYQKYPDMFSQEGETDGISVVCNLLKQGGVTPSICDCLAVASDAESETFRQMGLSDMMKCFKTFLEINDIDEVKKLFFDLKGLLTKQK